MITVFVPLGGATGTDELALAITQVDYVLTNQVKLLAPRQASGLLIQLDQVLVAALTEHTGCHPCLWVVNCIRAVALPEENTLFTQTDCGIGNHGLVRVIGPFALTVLGITMPSIWLRLLARLRAA